MMNWKQFIHIMEIDERGARAKYRTAARAAKNQSVKDIFEKLAYEEEVHLDVLDRFEKDLKTLLKKEIKR